MNKLLVAKKAAETRELFSDSEDELCTVRDDMEEFTF